MSLACMRITNHFHPNHFALKQRLGATRKWPINIVHLHSELVVIKALVVIHGFSVNYVFFISTFWSTTTYVDWKTVSFFFHNLFCKDAKGRHEIFAKSARALTAVKRKSMRNALVPGTGRRNFPREILIETIAENGVRQNIIERSSEIH